MRNRPDRRPAAVLLGLCLGLASAGAAASGGQEHHHHGSSASAADSAADPHARHRAMLRGTPPSARAGAVQVELRDRVLLNQRGRSVRFPDEVIGDRVVVMDFVYTSCTTVCPVLSTIMRQVQERMGERLGREVKLVSVSVDPGRDTPRRLAAYARRHHARAGWDWLTGSKPVVDEVLQGLDAYAPSFEDHAPTVLVGDPRSGAWTRFYGFASPDQIAAKVDDLLAARAAVRAAAGE